MSGGSFNYLYKGPPYDEHELLAMASWLRQHGMARAADETLSFIREADEALTDLWKAAEWCASADWSFADVVEAHDVYAETRDRP